jgi:hypothetical protein
VGAGKSFWLGDVSRERLIGTSHKLVSVAGLFAKGNVLLVELRSILGSCVGRRDFLFFSHNA